jgi:DNA-binding transcriptional MocR family regulator
MASKDFREVADEVAAEIAAGRLRPGERLPPQRDFAYARGIAVSTASRVYAELTRRGLVIGEVGRGTYVRSDLNSPRAVPVEPPPSAVDLQRTVTFLPEQEAVITDTLATLARGAAVEAAMQQVGPVGTPQAQAVAAQFLSAEGYAPHPSDIRFAGNGRQAIAAALAALASPGERIGCEPLTYPVVKGIASRLGIALIPLAMDDEGICPDAIIQTHRTMPLSGLYLQPSLQNPLGTTMGAGRRAELAAILERTGLIAIEDAVYGFHAEMAPLAASAPQHTILIDSLSKRVSPGLTVGMLAAPPGMGDRLGVSLRQGGWTTTGFPLAAGVHWMSTGAADRLAAIKRRDAADRQAIARSVLSDLEIVGDPRAYHLWLRLPDFWRADAYATAALRRGIALIPAAAFAVAPGYAQNAVRIALAAPSRDDLALALGRLRNLALSGDEQVVE